MTEKIRDGIKKWIDVLAYGSLAGDIGITLLANYPALHQYSETLINLATLPTIPLGIAYFYMSRHAIVEKVRGHTRKGGDWLAKFLTFGGAG